MNPDLLIAIAAAAAGIGLMWFVCIRPMRRMNGQSTSNGAAKGGCCASASNVDEQLEAARAELRRLRESKNGTPESHPSPTAP